MTNSVINELVVCVLCLMSGMLSGVIYDIFRVSRKVKKSNVYVVFIQDLVFWILTAFLAFYVIFYSNDGILRWYEIFLIGIGFFLYELSLSHLVSYIVEKIAKAVLRILKVTLKFILAPIYLIKKPVLKLMKKLRKTQALRFIRRLKRKQR